MKQFIAPTYTFTPGASGVGTVNLLGISGFNIKYLVAIINQTSGVVIYSTGSTSLGFTSLSGTTLTLSYNTSTMSSGDILQVIYETPVLPVDAVGTVTANAGTNLNTSALAIENGGNLDEINAKILTTNTTLSSIQSNTTAINQKLPSVIGEHGKSNSLSVTMAPDSSPLGVKSTLTNSKGEFFRNDYTINTVTTSAYTQLIASTTSTYSCIEIFDSSGQTLKLAFGGAGAEVDQFIIFPGGNGRIPFVVQAGTRISIKALSATANSGEIDLNCYV